MVISLDPFAEIDDVVLEGFQQDVDRLLAGLLVLVCSPRISVARFRIAPGNVLRSFRAPHAASPSAFRCRRAAISASDAARSAASSASARERCSVSDHLFLAAPEGFFSLRRSARAASRASAAEGGRGVAFARLCIGEPTRLPAPQEQDEYEYGGQTAGRQQEKAGKGLSCSVFDCKNNYSRNRILGPCIILFAPDGISCAEFYNFVSY